jgi:hypothetical protein
MSHAKVFRTGVFGCSRNWLIWSVWRDGIFCKMMGPVEYSDTPARRWEVERGGATFAVRVPWNE